MGRKANQYMVYGSLEVKLPEKMVKETKSGNVGFKQTVKKDGNLTSIAKQKSVKITTGPEPEVKVIKGPRLATIKSEKSKIDESKYLEAKAKKRIEASGIINRAIKGKIARGKVAELKK